MDPCVLSSHKSQNPLVCLMHISGPGLGPTQADSQGWTWECEFKIASLVDSDAQEYKDGSQILRPTWVAGWKGSS